MADGAQKIVSSSEIERRGVKRMSIFINKDTKVIVQGITGATGVIPYTTND